MFAKTVKKRFAEENLWLPKYQQLTQRLTENVIEKLSEMKTFKQVGKETNLSVSTVIRIFDIIHYPVKNVGEIISIDEFKGNTGNQKYHTLLTDPIKKTILDILPTRSKDYLFQYFLAFAKEEREQVKYFVSDMWETFANTGKMMFKQSKQIIDRYHFKRQVIWSFETIRKEEQSKLNKNSRLRYKRSKSLMLKRNFFLKESEKEQVFRMISTSKNLQNAYWLKEEFFSRYCKNHANPMVFGCREQ